MFSMQPQVPMPPIYVGHFLYYSICHSIKHVGIFADKRDSIGLQQISEPSQSRRKRRITAQTTSTL